MNGFEAALSGRFGVDSATALAQRVSPASVSVVFNWMSSVGAAQLLGASTGDWSGGCWESFSSRSLM